MTDRIHALLNCWFGDLGHADLPTSERTQLWFGDNEKLKLNLLENFREEYDAAVLGKLKTWETMPRGRLALIILFDQFSRIYHRRTPLSFAQDGRAQHLCVTGIEAKMDQSLTLIERVFFYMPLVHAEDGAVQETSIRLYQQLVALSMSETTQVYQLFLAYAYAHFRVIKEFGRFPQRNLILGRDSTAAESGFLRQV